MDQSNAARNASEQTARSLSRRSFLLGGCVGTASLLMSPLWSEGGTYAYAVDASNPEFKVFVLSVEEIGVAIVDVTGSKEAPLAGVAVTLTDRTKPNRKLRAVSDENGNVIFNIKEIAERVDLGGGDEVLRFDGSVEIVPPQGFRRTTLKRIRCNGGSGLRVPTCHLFERPKAYFRSMSFNGWDIQYFDNTVYRSLLNTDTHTIEGTIEAPGDTSVKVKLVSKGKDGKQDTVLLESDVSLTDSVGSFVLKGQFLYTNMGKVQLKPGESYAFDLVCSEGTFRYDARLSVLDSPIDLDAAGSPLNVMPSLDSGGSLPLFKIPSSDGIPAPFKGSTFSIWMPTLPFLFKLSPAGIFLLGIGADLTGNRSLAALDDRWKKETSKSIDEQVTALRKKYDDSFTKYRSMRSGVNPNGTAAKKVDFSGTLNASLAIQGYALLTYDWTAEVWNGSVNGIVQASLSAAFKWQTTIGPVPVFVMLEPGMDAKLTLTIGAQSHSPNPIDMSFDFSKAQAAFSYTISVALTVGVGLAGVASIALRGSGYISVYTGFELVGYQAGYPMPRFVAGYGLSADLVVQAFIFKWSGKIWSFKDDRSYDSWKAYGLQDGSGGFQSGFGDAPSELATNALPGSAGVAASGAYAHPTIVGDGGVSLGDFALNATIVTSQELFATREMNGTRQAGFSALEGAFEQPRSEDGFYVARMSVYEGLEGPLDEYAYEFVGEDLDASCADSPGVEGLGEGGALVPTVDQRIARNVFSNPLQKIVLFHNVPIMFRILSVSYEGEAARTRIAGQRYNAQTGKWDRPVVLEVPLKNVAARLDTFDYDFDVVTNSDRRENPAVRNGIHILLSSGKRPKGDQTSLLEAASNPIMTWLVVDEYLNTVSSYSWEDTAGKTDGGVHALSAPRIAVLPWKSKVDGQTYVNCIAACYLRHRASTLEDLFTERANTSGDFVLLAGDTLYQGHSFAVNPTTHDISITAHVLEQATTMQADLAFSVMSFSKDGARISSAVLRGDEHPTKDSKIMLESVFANVPDTAGIENVQTWPGRSAFLAVKDGVLYATKFELRKDNSPLETVQVGPSNSAISSFKVSQNGNVLTYLQNQDGTGALSFDKTGASKPVKANVHRILACVCAGDVFSEPFPLAEVKHAQDSLIAADGTSTSYAFLTSCITDMTTSAADLYYTTVPVITAVEFQGFVAEHQFVTQGVPDQPFLVTVKNVGNVILKGVELQLVESETGKPVDTRMLNFSKGALCASAWNPELYDEPDPELVALKQAYPDQMHATATDEAMPLLDPADANVLLPGKTGMYRVNFSIPQEWHGTVTVKLNVSAYSYDTVVSATSSPDDEATPPVLGYFPPDGFAMSAEVPVHHEADATEHEVDDSQAYEYVNGRYVPIYHTERTTTDPEATDDQGPIARLADSGDRTALSVAGLAATAAVAGLTAYSARRQALERAHGDDEAKGEGAPEEEGRDRAN